MFILKQYDRPLLSFDMTDDPLEGQKCHITKIEEAHAPLLPVGLKGTDEGLLSWLRGRIIPKNREFADALLAKSGLSLFNYAMPDELDNLDGYAKTRVSAYGAPFDNIARAFITARQKEKLRKMIGFRFERHSRYNMPAARLRAIEKHLQHRTWALLSLPDNE